MTRRHGAAGGQAWCPTFVRSGCAESKEDIRESCCSSHGSRSQLRGELCVVLYEPEIRAFIRLENKVAEGGAVRDMAGDVANDSKRHSIGDEFLNELSRKARLQLKKVFAEPRRRNRNERGVLASRGTDKFNGVAAGSEWRAFGSTFENRYTGNFVESVRHRSGSSVAAPGIHGAFLLRVAATLPSLYKRGEARGPMKKFKTVSEYLAAIPVPARKRLQEMRKLIRAAAPRAEEAISYNIPAFKTNGALLVWYAAFKEHIGLYPRTSAIAAFKSDLAAYKTSKGAIQFPIKRPIPVRLVKNIVRFRLKENSAKQRRL